MGLLAQVFHNNLPGLQNEFKAILGNGVISCIHRTSIFLSADRDLDSFHLLALVTQDTNLESLLVFLLFTYVYTQV